MWSLFSELPPALGSGLFPGENEFMMSIDVVFHPSLVSPLPGHMGVSIPVGFSGSLQLCGKHGYSEDELVHHNINFAN
jgi:hypothetical protein